MSDPSTPRLPRRAFLGAGAAALGPLVLTGKARALPANDPDVLRVGLIGCGGRGTGAAVQALRADPGAVLVAMADVFKDKLDASHGHIVNAMGADNAHKLAVDEDHRFVGFDAYERLIASDVDVVVLTTPPHFRPAMLEAAIAAGKHVFTEKPLAVDAPGVRRVMAAAAQAKQKGLSLVCGFCWRYNVRHREFYQRIHDGALGDLRAVYSTYNASPLGIHKRRDDWTDMEFQLRNWQHFTWLSGDHLVEQAVHSIDKQAWTFGDRVPRSAVAVGGRAQHEGPERGNVYDHFSVTYDYGDDVKAFHMARQWANCSGENSDYVYGEKGHGLINGWANKHVLSGPNAWTYEGPGNDMYQQEHDELFASIREGAAKNDGDWMTTSTLLAIMGRMAAYTGQTVTWDQALNSEWSLGPKTLAFGDTTADGLPKPGVTRLS